MKGNFYLNNKTLHIVGCSQCGHTVKTTPKKDKYKLLEEVIEAKGMYFSFITSNKVKTSIVFMGITPLCTRGINGNS